MVKILKNSKVIRHTYKSKTETESKGSKITENGAIRGYRVALLF